MNNTFWLIFSLFFAFIFLLTFYEDGEILQNFKQYLSKNQKVINPNPKSFFTNPDTLELAKNTCDRFGISFINEIALETESDNQNWEFVDLQESVLTWEKCKINPDQIELIFELYQNDWMNRAILQTEKYTTKQYQAKLWQIYNEQMAMDQRDIILAPKVLGMQIIDFQKDSVKIQINMEMINFKIWEYKKDNLSQAEIADQGKVASGSNKFQKCTEFWIFKLENGKWLLDSTEYPN